MICPLNQIILPNLLIFTLSLHPLIHTPYLESNTYPTSSLGAEKIFYCGNIIVVGECETLYIPSNPHLIPPTQ